MNDLKSMANSKELREASRASSKRWLNDSKWRAITVEEYVNFLNSIQGIKKELNAPDIPHPIMKGEKFSI